jgi:hypothetical protein
MNNKIIFFSLIFFIAVFPVPVFAVPSAELYLDPASGSHIIGNNFTVSVILDTGGTTVNAVQGDLTFDKSKFAVSSIDTSQSIFSIWVKYPSFSNSSGTISFAGGSPNPGFTGKGSIFTINFKGIALGTGGASFEPGQKVLLNDGLGTEITSNTSGGEYTILPSALSASCSALPVFANVNQSVVFNASASGGVGAYSYSWSGDCEGNSPSCGKSYDASGVKTATVQVTSGDKISSANCSTTIIAACLIPGENITTGGTVEPYSKYNICSLDRKCVSAVGKGQDQCQADDDCAPAIISQVFEAPKEQVQAVTKEVQKAINTPQGSVATKTISTAVAVVATAQVASAIAFSPFEIFLALSRLFGLLFAALGLKKRIKPWGVVYDSVTKQPLDPAYVVLNDLNGKKIASAITDLDGRYGFLVPSGVYQIVVNKTNYVFPSQKLSTRVNDELYNDLYFGEKIEIKQEGEAIVKNIPMDSLNFDWNEFAKRDKKLMRFYSKLDIIIRQIFDLFFIVGFVVAIVSYFSAPYPYNLVVLSIYLLLLLLRVIGVKPRAYGKISGNATGDPLSFAVLRVNMPGSNVEVAHKIADKYGRYYCLVPKGKYFVKIEKKNDDGSYSLVFTSGIIDASQKGIIKNTFRV